MKTISLASGRAEDHCRAASPVPKWSFGFVLLAGFMLSAVAARAEVAINIATNYYVVSGTNHTSIRAAMTQSRPWKEAGIYDARTFWSLRPHLTWRRVDDQFVLASCEVSTRIVITLPCWNATRPIDPTLAAHWQRFFRALSLHEQGHVQVARAAAAELDRRLSRLARYSSADDLTGAARRITSEVMEEFRKKDAAYDEVTRHGQVQGAVFHPGFLTAE